jgi:hypothetical protein
MRSSLATFLLYSFKYDLLLIRIITIYISNFQFDCPQSPSFTFEVTSVASLRKCKPCSLQEGEILNA